MGVAVFVFLGDLSKRVLVGYQGVCTKLTLGRCLSLSSPVVVVVVVVVVMMHAIFYIYTWYILCWALALYNI